MTRAVMRAKTRSLPSLRLFPLLPSFALHISYGNERKWTNKSEVERETLSPSPEKIATRDSLSLSLFSFNQKLTRAVQAWVSQSRLPACLLSKCVYVFLPFPLSTEEERRHFGRPIDCDVTLVLARTTAALTNMTSSGAPRRAGDDAGDTRLAQLRRRICHPHGRKGVRGDGDAQTN